MTRPSRLTLTLNYFSSTVGLRVVIAFPYPRKSPLAFVGLFPVCIPQRFSSGVYRWANWLVTDDWLLTGTGARTALAPSNFSPTWHPQHAAAAMPPPLALAWF